MIWRRCRTLPARAGREQRRARNRTALGRTAGASRRERAALVAVQNPVFSDRSMLFVVVVCVRALVATLRFEAREKVCTGHRRTAAGVTCVSPKGAV